MRLTVWFLALTGIILNACGDDSTPGGDTDTADTADAPDTADTTDTLDTSDSADGTDTADTADSADTAPDDTEPDTEPDGDTDTPAELALASGDRCEALAPVASPALPFDVEGDTSNAGDDYIYTTGDACGGPAGQGVWGDASGDLVYAFTPALSATYRIALTPAFDAGLMVTDACPPIGEDGFSALTCLGVSDEGEGAPEVLRLELVAGRTYYILVDGWSNDTSVAGTFSLSIAIGEDCDDGLDNDGNDLADCADAQCVAEPGCDESGFDAGCENDSDDDGDGETDCADPDCDGDRACDESTAEGGCTNDLDDEGDGRTDCADPDCAAEVTCDESTYEGGCDNADDDDGDGLSDCDDADCGRATPCLVVGETCETPAALDLDVPARGTTLGRLSDYGTDAAVCNVSTSSGDSFGLAAPDAVFRFTPEASGRYVFATESDFDDALTVTSDCAFTGGLCYGVERSGTGGEKLVVELAGGEDVFVIVDGWSNSTDTNAGDFTLTVSRATADNSEDDCANTSDDDGDGDTDCADSDCAFDRAHCVEIGHCDDGLDNDVDEAIDCDDSDCRSDVVACPPPPGDTCSTPGDVPALATPVEVDTCAFGSDYAFAEDAGCIAPTYESPDGVLSFTAPSAGSYVVEVESDEMDSILDVVLGDTCPSAAVTACDGSSDDFPTQRVSLALAAGDTAWLIVSGYGDSWDETPGCGLATVTVFEVDPEDCDDEADNDRDGAFDCDDADCAVAPACNEAANGPGACADTQDDEGDGLTDCYDPDCATTPECPNGVPGDSCLSPVAASGEVWTATLDTCNYTHQFDVPDEDGGCQSTSSGTTPTDVVVRYAVAATGDYRVSMDPGPDGTSSFDALLNVVVGATCPTSPLATCAGGSDLGDPEAVTVSAQAGSVLWIIGGGWSSGCGTARFSVALLGPEVCDDQVDNDGDDSPDCADDDCKAFPDCVEVCDDKLDNDVDGLFDCADDDCDATPDCNEAANGAGACGDALDNDGDGVTDCYDGDCKAAAACPDGAVGDTCDGAVLIDSVAWSETFSTCDYTSDFEQFSNGTCTTMGSAGDLVVHLVAPQAGDYRVTFTTGQAATSVFDSVINIVRGAACPSASAAPIDPCADGVDDASTSPPFEGLTFAAAAGESIWILADGYGSGCGTATLDVVLLEDEVCDDEIDNDGDSTTDCADRDCKVSEPLLCPTPAGDLCGAAIAIAALPFTDDSRTLCTFATDYETDDLTCMSYSGPEVVYRYTAAAAQTLEVTLVALDVDVGGEFMDMVVSASDVCPTGDMLDQCLASEDSEFAEPEVLQISVDAGQTIYFFASNYYQDECASYRLEVSALP